MMNKNFLFIALFLFCTAYAATAQVDTIRLRGDGSRPKIVTDRPPQAVYFQVLGSGPILSVMYDRRLGKKVNGLGFAVGLGYWGEDGDNIFSIPVQLNYLFGRQTHFIELAGGTTYVTAAESFFDTESSGFIYHINLGYRHQPTKGGFFFRGGYSPLFYDGENVTSFYLGFGHNF